MSAAALNFDGWGDVSGFGNRRGGIGGKVKNFWQVFYGSADGGFNKRGNVGVHVRCRVGYRRSDKGGNCSASYKFEEICTRTKENFGLFLEFGLQLFISLGEALNRDVLCVKSNFQSFIFFLEVNKGILRGVVTGHVLREQSVQQIKIVKGSDDMRTVDRPGDDFGVAGSGYSGAVTSRSYSSSYCLKVDSPRWRGVLAQIRAGNLGGGFKAIGFKVANLPIFGHTPVTLFSNAHVAHTDISGTMGGFIGVRIGLQSYVLNCFGVGFVLPIAVFQGAFGSVLIYKDHTFLLFIAKSIHAESVNINFGSYEVGPFEIGISEIGPCEVGPCEISLPEIGPCEIGPYEIGPSEIGRCAISKFEIGPYEIGPCEVGPCEVGPYEVCDRQIRDYVRIILPPFVPNFAALFQYFYVFFIRHFETLPLQTFLFLRVSSFRYGGKGGQLYV